MPQSKQAVLSAPSPEPFKIGEERTLAEAALEFAAHAFEQDDSPASAMAYAQVLSTLSVSKRVDEVGDEVGELNTV